MAIDIIAPPDWPVVYSRLRSMAYPLASFSINRGEAPDLSFTICADYCGASTKQDALPMAPGRRYADAMIAAESTLSLLFKKLHPILEDTAHALSKGASGSELERLHLKLLRDRFVVAEALDKLVSEETNEDLIQALEELASNLTPSGETFQQSLVLTQLCLEDAPETFLPFLPEEAVETSSWGKRLKAFQELLKDPTNGAHARWETVDPDIGESEDE
jgi:hypothetical protein